MAAQREADLAIDKDDGLTQVTPGDLITYAIIITNAGPDDVVGATVTDNFPSGLTGVSWMATTSAGASVANASGSGNISELISIDVGETVTYTVLATVDTGASGTIANVASVNKLGLVDPNLSNNTDDDIDTVVLPADLELDKSFVLLTDNDASGGGNITPGDTIQFTVVVTNDSASPFDATGVTVSDPLPNGYTFVSSDALANGYTYSPGSGVWNIGPLDIGDSAMLNVTATVKASGNYTKQ